MNDRELLELAAKAAGYTPERFDDEDGIWLNDCNPDYGYDWWNPLTDDGDAFRLAVKLKMQVVIHNDWVEGMIDGIQLSSPASCYSADGCMLETTRRAIVSAAAKMADQPLSGK